MNNSNITDTPPPFVGLPMNLAARVIFIIMGSLEIIVGVFGNLLLLSVILRRRYLRNRSVHKLFIANLALGDLLTLGYWMTYFVLDLCLGYHPVVNMTHCLANAYVISVSFVSSALSLTSITLNRYLHVCHNRLFTRIFSMRTTLIWCLMVWVLAIFIILPSFFGGVGSYHYNSAGHFCSLKRTDPHVYPKIVVLACSLVPMILVGYWNYAIYRFWKNAHSKVKTSHKKNRSKDKRRRVRLVKCWKSGQTKIEAKTAAIQSEQPPDYDGDSSEDALDSCDNVEQQSSDEQPTERRYNPQIGGTNASGGSGINRKPCKVSGINQRPSGESGVDQLPVESCSTPDTADGLGETTSSTQQELSLSNEDSRPFSALTAARKLEARPHLPRAKERPSPLTQLQTRQKAKLSREEAFGRSLRVVFFLLVISFLPFGISIALNWFMPLPPELVISANTFMHFNNALNWVVYGAMNPSFRRGYIKNLKWLFGPCIRALCRYEERDDDKHVPKQQ